MRLALDEMNNIWTSNPSPDIIVSVGTGIEVDGSGKPRMKRLGNLEALKAVLPPGFRKAVDVGLDMVASTLNCQREWDDFVTSNPLLAPRSHRLDVGFAKPVPKLDDVDKMQMLKEYTENYVREDSRERDFNSTRRNAYDQLEVVARNLIAALFYFSEPINGHAPGPRRVTGFITCRLPPDTKAAVSELGSQVLFRLNEKTDETSVACKTTQIATPVHFKIETMSIPVEFNIEGGKWHHRTIEVQIVNRSHIWSTISGF